MTLPTATVQTPFGPLTAQARRQDVPRDPEINTDDTYMTAELIEMHEATVFSPAPVYDATSGTMTSAVALDIPPEPFYVEVGYDAQGDYVFNKVELDPPGNPQTTLVDDARTVSVHDDQFALYDAAGQAITLDEPMPALSEAMDDGGSNGGGGGGGGASAPGMPVPSAIDGLVLVDAPDASPARLRALGAARSERLPGGRVRLHSEMTLPGADGVTVRQSRTYRAKRGVYVLDETTQDFVKPTGDGGRVESRTTTRYVTLNWHRNETADAARRNRRTGATPVDGARYTTPPPCEGMANPTEECQGSGGSGGGGGEPCPAIATGANVVFMHGINSTGGGWGSRTQNQGVRGYIDCRLQVNHDRAPSLGTHGFASHASQVDDLYQEVLDTGVSNTIFVAHSQGGLISRRVAQRFYANGQSSMVRGVITIGTPHQGANIMRSGAAVGYFTDTVSGLNDQGRCRRLSLRCSLTSSLLSSAMSAVLTGVAATPAGLNLAPGSSAIAQANAVPETFARYGIQHYVNKRWAFARVGAEALNASGKRAVDATNGIYIVTGVASRVLWFAGGWGGTVAAISRLVHDNLDEADHYWNQITAGNDRSDGVVQGLSQIYPNALLNRTAIDPVSHTGETKLNRSAQEVEYIMNSLLGVAPRPNL